MGIASSMSSIDKDEELSQLKEKGEVKTSPKPLPAKANPAPPKMVEPKKVPPKKNSKSEASKPVTAAKKNTKSEAPKPVTPVKKNTKSKAPKPVTPVKKNTKSKAPKPVTAVKKNTKSKASKPVTPIVLSKLKEREGAQRDVSTSTTFLNKVQSAHMNEELTMNRLITTIVTLLEKFMSLDLEGNRGLKQNREVGTSTSSLNVATSRSSLHDVKRYKLNNDLSKERLIKTIISLLDEYISAQLQGEARENKEIATPLEKIQMTQKCTTSMDVATSTSFLNRVEPPKSSDGLTRDGLIATIISLLYKLSSLGVDEGTGGNGETKPAALPDKVQPSISDLDESLTKHSAIEILACLLDNFIKLLYALKNESVPKNNDTTTGILSFGKLQPSHLTSRFPKYKDVCTSTWVQNSVNHIESPAGYSPDELYLDIPSPQHSVTKTVIVHNCAPYSPPQKRRLANMCVCPPPGYSCSPNCQCHLFDGRHDGNYEGYRVFSKGESPQQCPCPSCTCYCDNFEDCTERMVQRECFITRYKRVPSDAKVLTLQS